jgi:NitT/TauT family transport system substrate-binding protein
MSRAYAIPAAALALLLVVAGCAPAPPSPTAAPAKVADTPKPAVASPVASPAASPAASPSPSPSPSPAAAASPTAAPVAAAKPSGPLTPVGYGADFLISGTTAPIYLAIERGYFAEGGIEVSVSRGYGSADAVKRAATGQADIVQGDIGTAMLLRANEDARVKVVSPLYGKVPFAVLFYEDQNIRTPKDLEGKTIADAAGSAPRVLFPAFAGLTGIDPAKVTFRTVDASTRNTVFAAGQLEIITAFILNLADVEKLAYESRPDRKIGAMRYADYGLDMYGNGYITSDSMVAEKPQAVAAFVDGAAKGLRDTYRDVPAAVDVVRKYAPEVDKAVGVRQLELIRDLLLTDDMVQNGLGTFQQERLEKTKDIMQQYFEMKGDLPLADIHTTQLVPRTPVKP